MHKSFLLATAVFGFGTAVFAAEVSNICTNLTDEQRNNPDIVAECKLAEQVELDTAALREVIVKTGAALDTSTSATQKLIESVDPH